MNYLELYPGDYLRDTKHLPLASHGAYLLLLMAYYSTERPLPADFESLCRIAGAMTAPEQKAVRAVEAFFPIGPDGLRHNARADAEIAKAQRRIVAAKTNGRKGGRPPKENPPGFDSDTHREPTGKALHTPCTTTQEQPSRQAPENSKARAPTAAGEACRLMRQAGCTQTNPAHPDLIAALDEGVTPQTLADTVREAVEAGKGNPFTWAIATARGRHAQGAKPIAAGPPHAQGPPQHRLSKTALGIASLQELIDDTRHEMAADRTLEGPAEARHALAGPNSRG